MRSYSFTNDKAITEFAKLDYITVNTVTNSSVLVHMTKFPKYQYFQFLSKNIFSSVTKMIKSHSVLIRMRQGLHFLFTDEFPI